MADKVSILEVVQEGALVKEEPTTERNHPAPSTDKDHLQEEITSEKGINVIPFVSFVLSMRILLCTELFFF